MVTVYKMGYGSSNIFVSLKGLKCLCLVMYKEM